MHIYVHSWINANLCGCNMDPPHLQILNVELHIFTMWSFHNYIFDNLTNTRKSIYVKVLYTSMVDFPYLYCGDFRHTQNTNLTCSLISHLYLIAERVDTVRYTHIHPFQFARFLPLFFPYQWFTGTKFQLILSCCLHWIVWYIDHQMP